eukprot:COSAG06_NODE_815_length_12103_cov_4.891458_6_plen_62_part_00
MRPERPAVENLGLLPRLLHQHAREHCARLRHGSRTAAAAATIAHTTWLAVARLNTECICLS